MPILLALFLWNTVRYFVLFQRVIGYHCDFTEMILCLVFKICSSSLHGLIKFISSFH
jgi:hypothetical protein